MLLTILKILLFFVALAGVVFAADIALRMSGVIRVSAFNHEISFEPILLLIALVGLFLLFWLMLKILGLSLAVWKFINGDETAVSRYFDRSRERRGFDALSDGMLALASGDPRAAITYAAKAERHLKKPEITDLLVTQAAEQARDEKTAKEAYKRLLRHERTRFIGIQGILKQKLAEGDTETARKLAQKAFALRPRHEQTQDKLLALQARDENWKGVRATLRAKLKHGAITRDVYKRREAVIIAQEARIARTAGKIEEAQTLAMEANRLSPTLVPGATLAARALLERNTPRKALSILKAAWQHAPHPELAAEFAAIRPDESPGDRIVRFAALTRLHPDHPETRMLLAELHISAEDFPAARRALGDLSSSDPTGRSLSLMATIAHGEGAEQEVVRDWLTKAVSAPPDPLWICNACGHTHLRWNAACEQCDTIDSLEWKRPLKDFRSSMGVLSEANADPLTLSKEGTDSNT